MVINEPTMKNLILLIAILFIGACASMPTVKSVAGTYELKKDEFTLRYVLLENGVWEWYAFGKKQGVIPKNSIVKWSIVDGEIHIDNDSRGIKVYRINTDKSITRIAYIIDGKRREAPRDEQRTFKKIK